MNELYQAMDVFVMPSFFEGIPVTGIEAQFSGLTCVFSDRVPQEVNFSGNCEFLSLKTDAKSWAQRIWQNTEAINGQRKAGVCREVIIIFECTWNSGGLL